MSVLTLEPNLDLVPIGASRNKALSDLRQTIEEALQNGETVKITADKSCTSDAI